MNRLRALWWRVSASLWFVPSLMVLGAVVLAVGLVEFTVLFNVKFADEWPRLFGVGAEGSRGMLGAIAGSMITIAGVVFSVTVVALSLASSQHSPRLLRAFMSDKPTQVVLGVFVSVFAYCLVVLRTIRSGEEETFVPSLAVLGGIVLAFVSIGFLVYFIHHLAASLEVSSILGRLAQATMRAVDGLFPEELGEPAQAEPLEYRSEAWVAVPVTQTGYIVTVDSEGLLACARKLDRVLRMEHGIGEFVIEGQTLVWAAGSEKLDDATQAALNGCFTYDRQRTTEQDADFGVQQIVDIALKALSPGVNDPTTAVMCIDRLTQILVRLARRRIETPYRRDEGGLRVIAVGPSFASLVALAYRAPLHHARSEPNVLSRLLWSIDQVAAAASDPQRLRMLAAERARVRDALQAAQSR